jgi:hypothetical protein
MSLGVRVQVAWLSVEAGDVGAAGCVALAASLAAAVSAGSVGFVIRAVTAGLGAVLSTAGTAALLQAVSKSKPQRKNIEERENDRRRIR